MNNAVPITSIPVSIWLGWPHHIARTYTQILHSLFYLYAYVCAYGFAHRVVPMEDRRGDVTSFHGAGTTGGLELTDLGARS